MANKLAGQRAKFSKALRDFNISGDEPVRSTAVRRMAEVLRDAPTSGFTEEEVTQDQDYPASVAEEIQRIALEPSEDDEDQAALVAEAEATVDQSGLQVFGIGSECVYAYGYACAPDRLKIGRAAGDPAVRIAAQITTSTPDRPKLLLVFRTEDAGSLERGLHAWFRLRGQWLSGGGLEWFRVNVEEVIEAFQAIMPAAKR